TVGSFRLDGDRVVAGGLLLFGLSLLGFAVLRSPAPAYPAVFAVGYFYFATVTTLSTRLQQQLDDGVRGRVMALYMTLVMGGTPLGAPVVGWVGATFGARWTLIGGGLMSLLGVGLAVLVYRGLRTPLFPFGRRVGPSAEETADELLAA
ncbi:MAG: MFS transporter, partial [Marmoricola sp.]|nr:MFS transporter [Marmoricola sp.]